MIASILRLFALRPFFTLAIFGIPIVVLVIVGLLTIMAFKFLIFIVIPVALVVWLIRAIMRAGGDRAG